MRFLNSFKKTNGRTKKRHDQRRRLGGESLEPRLMMSLNQPEFGSTSPNQDDAFVNVPSALDESMATISLENGVLKVNGTNDDDVIEIKNSFFYFEADINSKIKTLPAIEATLRDSDGNVLRTGRFSLALVNEIVVHAFGGDDTVSNATYTPSEIFGGFGNDNLYGGFGADVIWGEEGNDGLFGGDEFANDYLHGGIGFDRYLVKHGSPGVIAEPGATIIKFHGSPGETTNVHGFQESAIFGPGSWSRHEIIQVDQTLAEVHHFTNNSNLLHRGSGPISFVRLGTQTAGHAFAATNDHGVIKVADNAFAWGDARLMQTIFHEIGHNWDEESPFWTQFKALSGWDEGNTVPPDHEASMGEGDLWYYYSTPDDPENSAKFAEDYGKLNPMEDFATSFAAYFMYRVGLPYSGGPGMANIPNKIWLIHNLLSSISSSEFGYSPLSEGLTTRDKSAKNLQQSNQFVQKQEPVAVRVRTPVETAPRIRRDLRTQEPVQKTLLGNSNLAARDAAFADFGLKPGNEKGPASEAFPKKVTGLKSFAGLSVKP